jgi:uncharacterized protein (DUF934 family)
MPRRLLRDGRIVEDDWTYATETEESAETSLILNLTQWQGERDKWDAPGRRLGVVLLPAHKIDSLAADISRFELIALDFPGPSEGRGYSQARMLREQLNFKGELRATGFVRRDQLFFMARCGFNSFELPDTDLAGAHAALSTFTWAYQPSNDAGLPLTLPHRPPPDIPASV